MPGIARHTPTLTGNKAVRLVIADTAFLPHLGELLSHLSDPNEWYEAGSTIEDTVASAWDMLVGWYDNLMIGLLGTFVTTPPDGWLELDGTTYAEADYPELYAAVPAGWKSGTNFTLPDAQDVFINGVGSSGTLAATGGSASHTLAANEMPAHTHTYTMPLISVDTVGVGAPLPVADQITPGTPTGSAGGGAAHENRPPFLQLVFAIYAGRG